MTQDAFGAVLHSLRASERMKQGEFARQLHVHRNTVGAWERGEYLPDLTTVHEIVRILHLDEHDAERLFAAHSTKSPLVVPWNLPALRNPFFTGREHMLQRLHNALQATSGETLVALYGLAGIGKTHVALEYAYRFQKVYRFIFWVQAETSESILGSYLTIADILELPERHEPNQSQVLKAIKRWLHTHTNWLLIYDNVENFDQLQHYLPISREGAILLTTRTQATGNQFPSFELEAMSLEEAALLLLRRGKLISLAQSWSDLASEEQEQASSIAEQLGGLPLALDQAGAYLEEHGCPLEEYLTLYHAHRQQLLCERGSMAVDHPSSVETTFLLAFDRVQQQNPEAADVLRFCAFLAPEAIPRELIWPAEKASDPLAPPLTSNALTFYAIVKDLMRSSLAHFTPKTQMLCLHRLVQEVLKEAMGRETGRLWIKRAIRTLHALFPPLPLSAHVQEWPMCERLLSHVLACVTLSEQWQCLLPETALLSLRAAEYLFERYRSPEAIALAQKALAVSIQVLGPEHLDTAECLNLLGNIYQRQGKYEEAEQFARQALALRERELGAAHVLVVESLTNIAVIVASQGQDERAAVLLQRSLAIGEHEWEQAHIAMSLLAQVYMRQGRYCDAEPLQRRAMEIREQELGPSHPGTALSMTRLGDLYRQMGRYAKAEPLLSRALEIREQQFGPDDLSTAHSQYTIGLLYLEAGRYTEAEHLLQRALVVLERIQGPTHPDTTPCLQALADFFRFQKKYEQAQAIGQRALQADEQTFGRQHPRVARSLSLLGMLACEQKHCAEAEALLQEALAIYEHSLPAADPRATAVLHALGVISRQQGRQAEAEQFLRRALALREEWLGSGHPQVAESLAELAQCSCEQGRLAEGETLARRALCIAEPTLGCDHPLTRKLRETALR